MVTLPKRYLILKLKYIDPNFSLTKNRLLDIQQVTKLVHLLCMLPIVIYHYERFTNKLLMLKSLSLVFFSEFHYMEIF